MDTDNDADGHFCAMKMATMSVAMVTRTLLLTALNKLKEMSQVSQVGARSFCFIDLCLFVCICMCVHVCGTNIEFKKPPRSSSSSQ